MLGVFPPDLVFAARLLRKSRGFTLVAAVSLALAIGANTTIFSVAKQLLFERLDVPDAANLRLLTSTDASFSYPVYEQLRAQNQVLGDLLGVPRDGGQCDGRRQRGARDRARGLGKLLRRSRCPAATRPRDWSRSTTPPGAKPSS